MEPTKSAFAVGMILLVLFGAATSFFEFQAALSQPDHFEDLDQSEAKSVDLHRKGKPATWYLGKGLGPGSSFTYKVCDMVLIIPESPDQCYQLSLEFIDTLKGPHGDAWIVQAVMDHQDKRTYTIFQISATTFDITTDGTSIPYADSVSRTIFWIGKFANKFDQKPLAIGKSWGKIATHTAPETELIIRNEVTGVDSNEQQFQTFTLGYNLIEQSTLSISEDFPFPIKAVIYKPTTTHQNTPLQFTIELVDYNRNDLFDDSPRQTFPNQNESSESINDFEDDILLNEIVVDENTTTDYTTDSNELNVTKNLEEDNSSPTEDNYLDAINLEKLFEMFLTEHFDDDNSNDQILNFTVFLDFLNKTDSAIIDNRNFTEIQP